MAVTLGYLPERLTVILTPGSAFASQLVNSAGPWQTGDIVSLRFGDGTEWEATITGPTAAWSLPASAVQAVIAAGTRTVTLWYVNGATSIQWASGTVEVSG